MAGMWSDVRQAARRLAGSRWVTSAALISLALGIGANTTIFSLMNALLLRQLPVRDPGELVSLSIANPTAPSGKMEMSLANFAELRRSQQVFSGMFAWPGVGLANLDANGVKFTGGGMEVTGDYFSTLGVESLLGRTITGEDARFETSAPAPAAVLDYRCWVDHYSRDPAIIGKIIGVNGHPMTIIGVTPKTFGGLIVESAPDVTVPLGYNGRQTYSEARNSISVQVMGRLKPGVTLEKARAQIEALWPHVLEATLPDGLDARRRTNYLARRILVDTAATGVSYMRPRFAQPLHVLMALAGLVLLIACANVANLMVALASERQHEIGVRFSLGATRWRIVRQLLMECLMLSGAGAALGIVVAEWMSRLLANTMWSGFVAAGFDPTPDLRVLAFTSGVAFLAGVLFGLAPAWTVRSGMPWSALRANARTVRGGGGLRRLLVVGQVALALMLTIGAGLFSRSLQKLRTVDLGFRRDGVFTAQLFENAPDAKIPNRTGYYRDLAEKAASLPGVESASYSWMGPVLSYEFKEKVVDDSRPDAAVPGVEEWIGPGFFRVMRMHLVAGRDFDWWDDDKSSRVTILSESLARRLFPGEDAIGKQIDVGTAARHRGMTIVGVVNSASLWVLRSPQPLAVYMGLMQEPDRNQPTLVLRTERETASISAALRRTIESMGRHYPLRIESLRERTDSMLADDRVLAVLSAYFGGLALLLACVGLYGSISHAVTRRTGEIGLRMALGAEQKQVLRLILGDVIGLMLVGIGVGMAGTLAAGRLVSGLLFGLSPADPTIMLLAAGTLAASVLLAGYLPARRAARIDPLEALRCD